MFLWTALLGAGLGSTQLILITGKLSPFSKVICCRKLHKRSSARRTDPQVFCRSEPETWLEQ